MSGSALPQIAPGEAIYKKLLLVTFILTCSGICPLAASPPGKKASHHEKIEESTRAERIELWRPPRDIRSRDLFYGPGGKEHAPHTTYTFIKEDLHGTKPKLLVYDENGIKWRVKMGAEVRPETTASRLLWAVGYSTNEFYFLPNIKIEGLPAHLHRGQNLIRPDGTILNVEMRRKVKGAKKIDTWHWRHNPFTGTRELNGLRVMMALLNNWDLKDDNNAVYEVGNSGQREEIYWVSDLGASFGSTGATWRYVMSRGGVRAYSHSRFIRRVTSQYVDFNLPTRPALIYIFNPPGLIMRLRMRWIGRRIPRADARWVGSLLAQLSPGQIRDAFRGGGYSPEDVENYAQVLERRIRELNSL
jgi:hypothetical protein